MKRLLQALGSRSLSNKIAALLLCTTAVTLGLAAAAFGHYTGTQARSALQREVESLMGVVGANSTAALSFRDQNAAAENLAPLGTDPRILAVALYTPGGEPLASWSRVNHTVPAFPCPAEAQFSSRGLKVCRPVVFQGDTVGYLAADVDTTQVSQRIWRAGAFAALFVLVSLGVLLPLALRVVHWMFRPLRELEGVAVAVAQEGRYDLRATKLENDEVGRLIDCFNHMMEQIEQRDAELLRHGERLEAEVAERTRELVLAKERAETGARVKSQFLANMSHEIRTPITGVMGAIELALESELSAEQRGLLKMAGGSARSLLAVINDILDFSKIEAGKLTLAQVEFPVEDVFARTLGSVALAAHRKGLELLANLPDEIPPVLLGDPDRLQQILLNLVGNAVKFTSTGEVELSASVVARAESEITLRFEIRDTGIGIPLDQQQAIFDSFTQADGSVSRHFGGTGLGLTISRRLAHMMQGDLAVESRPGFGSRFSLTARFALAAQDAGVAAAHFDGPVLILASTPPVAANLSRMAKQLGLTPRLADSDEEIRLIIDSAAGALRLAVVDCRHELATGERLESALEHAGFAGAALLLSPSHRILDNEKVARKIGRAQVCPMPVLPGALATSLRRLLDPTAAGELEAVARAVTNAGDPAHRKLRILLAEDNAVNRHIVTTRLKKMGHQVKTVGNGALALSAMESSRYDAVLMDVQMPEMDGLTATRMQRQRETRTGRDHQWILGLTANALAGDAERCYEAGMDDYLTKPVDFGELERRLQALIPASPQATTRS